MLIFKFILVVYIKTSIWKEESRRQGGKLFMVSIHSVRFFFIYNIFVLLRNDVIMMEKNMTTFCSGNFLTEYSNNVQESISMINNGNEIILTE